MVVVEMFNCLVMFFRVSFVLFIIFSFFYEINYLDLKIKKGSKCVFWLFFDYIINLNV